MGVSNVGARANKKTSKENGLVFDFSLGSRKPLHVKRVCGSPKFCWLQLYYYAKSNALGLAKCREYVCGPPNLSKFERPSSGACLCLAFKIEPSEDSELQQIEMSSVTLEFCCRA